MIIDVLINSCARPDILEVSIETFMKYVKSDRHEFRYVILEDVVADVERQALGRKWITDRKKLFDEIVFKETKMGPGFFFAPVVSLCKSKYFFHLEDDNQFIKEINIDPLVDILSKNDYFVEILMSRGAVPKTTNPRNVNISGVKLTEFDFFSVATGIFNTELVCKLIDSIGWDKRLHEAGILTPTSKKLGFRKFILGHNDLHYVHVGAEKGYKKGSWRK